MDLKSLLSVYAGHPQITALAKIAKESVPSHVFCEGLLCSAAPLVFAALSLKKVLPAPI